MDNYIVINGKKAELTQEQLEKLGIVVEKDAFERVGSGEWYYAIVCTGDIAEYKETESDADNNCFNAANYCTDKELMEQRALHETLNRLLWRYSMQNGGRDLEWDDYEKDKWSIYFNKNTNLYDVTSSLYCVLEGTVYFCTKTLAQAAIEEIVKPFMEQHPEFRW